MKTLNFFKIERERSNHRSLLDARKKVNSITLLYKDSEGVTYVKMIEYRGVRPAIPLQWEWQKSIVSFE